MSRFVYKLKGSPARVEYLSKWLVRVNNALKMGLKLIKMMPTQHCMREAENCITKTLFSTYRNANGNKYEYLFFLYLCKKNLT